MDTKNVIAAISLSAAVIILYSLFWAPSPQDLKQVKEEKKQIIESTEAPSLEVEEKVLEISRSEAKSKNQRIEFENISIKGSISLMGSIIDDLTFKKYTETLEGNDQVVLLNPKNLKNGYYVETGWATNSENIDVPNSKTLVASTVRIGVLPLSAENSTSAGKSTQLTIVGNDTGATKSITVTNNVILSVGLI